MYYYSHPERHTFPIIIVKLQDHGVSGSDFRKTSLVSVSNLNEGLGVSVSLGFYHSRPIRRRRGGGGGGKLSLLFTLHFTLIFIFELFFKKK